MANNNIDNNNSNSASHQSLDREFDLLSVNDSSSPTTYKSPRNSSSYTSNINADIQARLLKFQEQRRQPNSNSNSTTTLSTMSTSSNNLQAQGSSAKPALAEKPLPPLPPSTTTATTTTTTTTTSSTASTSSTAHNPLQKPFNPLRPAPALPINSQVSPQIAARLPKQKTSLSMRRGMKLPLPDQSNPVTGSSNGPASPTGKPNKVSDMLDKRGKAPQPQLKGLFANYSNYIDIKSGSLNFKGKLSLDSKGVDFSSGSSFRISSDELEFIEELGRGNYGTVSKVLHKPTGITMAMKEVRLELDESKFRQILMELEVLHKCNSPYIVDFYGAFFVEGAVYMCIEYMDGGSLDKIYGEGVDEHHLAFITDSVIRGLKELKDNHNIIHRDVKPTNILVNSQGKVKLCDFGVSGNLVASLAKTNIGCQSYMAPERIKSLNPDDVSYSVQSDIWSLGLTILETAKGCYPYPPETYDNIFSQLSAIVDGEPPALPDNFSAESRNFVESCLNKTPEKRPDYKSLLSHPWLLENRNVEMAEYIKARINDSRKNQPLKNEQEFKELNSHLKTPALHKGGAMK